jgi:hypothetical protein
MRASFAIATQSRRSIRSLLGKERRRAPETAANNSSGGGPLHYHLSTEIPDYWIPLMPVRTAQGLRLKRGAVLNTDGLPEPVHALGRIEP